MKALTILDEGLRAGEPSMSCCHVEGSLVVLTLDRRRESGCTCLGFLCILLSWVFCSGTVHLIVSLGSSLSDTSVLEGSEWTDPRVDHMHTHTHIPWAACSLGEPTPTPFIFHMALHLETVGSPVSVSITVTKVLLTLSFLTPCCLCDGRWFPIYTEFKYISMLTFIAFIWSAYGHTRMLMWAPWVNRSSWHNAPWRDDEAKWSGEKPLSFT